MKYVLALDQGTTSSRAIVLDRAGTLVAVAQQEFEQIFPQPGWVEHDANEIWSTQSRVADEALQQAGATASDVAAVGITNQRETTVLWDRATGAPIANAIVWQDRRTAADCERLRARGHVDTFRDKTGLVLDAYFSGTKVAWLLDNIAGARAKAERGELAFGTIDSWLAYRLTEGALHITDPSNASRTLLYNIHSNAWDDELLEILDVPRGILPEVKSSSEVYGQITADLAIKGAPLAGIVGDQQAATMGQICIEPGRAKNTYGTGCFFLLNTGQEARPSHNNLLTTVAWQRDGKVDYALEGSVFMGGAIVQWLRDGLGMIESAPQSDVMAESVDGSDGVYFVPALTGLGAPHWDPYARGMIIGITRGTTRNHIARAALEGIAYQVADLADAMQADAGSPITELRVDGGAAASDFLMQFQADLLRIPVVRPTILETTALGAAYMAGLAVGYWESVDEIAQNWQVDRIFEPQMPESQAIHQRARWSEAVERAKGWERGADA
ncbi:MAG: glycerol kinase GlpK [Verrucomicrobia bacterium]|nr:glycerol kinase GlpK [Verrucomicrobiota bacterium]MDA1087701.1 glycerol kinase GlpK [Verrucomicrobiota bacterium]